MLPTGLSKFMQPIIINFITSGDSGPSAFRLKAHPGAVYESSLERGRPVLQGPLAANKLITEVGVFNVNYINGFSSLPLHKFTFLSMYYLNLFLPSTAQPSQI